MFYQMIHVGKEKIGLVWDEGTSKPKISRIYLPDAQHHLKDKILKDYPAINRAPLRISGGIDDIIAGLYAGQPLKFDLSCLNWSGVSEFSARVLRQTYKIPRGKVLTYAGLAARSGAPGAARAAGSVMANNPFPIVIPCHRVIRSDGSTGQFGGGSSMKKQLLEKEGMSLDAKGNVPQRYME